MIEGRIIKGIAGFYYVLTNKGIYECKAKGQFRKEKIIPIVGDKVLVMITDESKHLGNIQEILPRCNFLLRPPVANIDQGCIFFGSDYPKPSPLLMGKMLVWMEYMKIKPIIIFNKEDLLSDNQKEEYIDWFKNTGYLIYFHQATGKNNQDLLDALGGKVNVLVGPSGAGKSTFVNQIKGEQLMETGEISRKLNRGRHTTRHAQIILLERGGFIVDTPGFSSLELPPIEKEDLQYYYPEFEIGGCRFRNCLHEGESDCLVKDRVTSGQISRVRYQTYLEQLVYLEKEKKKRGY